MDSIIEVVAHCQFGSCDVHTRLAAGCPRVSACPMPEAKLRKTTSLLSEVVDVVACGVLCLLVAAAVLLSSASATVLVVEVLES